MNEPNEGVPFARCQSVDPGHDDHPRLILGEQQMLLRRHHLAEVNVDELKPKLLGDRPEFITRHPPRDRQKDERLGLIRFRRP